MKISNQVRNDRCRQRRMAADIGSNGNRASGEAAACGLVQQGTEHVDRSAGQAFATHEQLRQPVAAALPRAGDQLWSDERVLSADEPDELDAVWRAISARDDKSHKLWTGDYLAAFAQASDLTLATLDRKLPGRYPSVRVESLLP